MATKHKNLYLYLTLVCFVGLILVFIFDGYMGVYDSLSITAGEFPQQIEADQWQQQERYGYVPSASLARGESVSFDYMVENRGFSTYTASLDVSVWHGQQKVRDVLAQPVSVAAFGQGLVQWVVDSSQIIPADFPTDQSYDFTVVIKRDGMERRVIIYINPSPYVAKPIPVPAPPAR
jgi:hypothetical protein